MLKGYLGPRGGAARHAGCSKKVKSKDVGEGDAKDLKKSPLVFRQQVLRKRLLRIYSGNKIDGNTASLPKICALG